LFEDCEYYGIDVIPGPNVNVVNIAHKYIVDEPFDVVLSTNALEHDMFLKQTITWMLSNLKPEGLLFFSAASTHFEHGTKRTTPENSGTSQMGIEWENYYHNISEIDIYETLNWSNILRFEMTQANAGNNSFEMDLRFWGIKKG
jgi:2-polyprenyl-3-methyl-5-hydroxy-6-metoxy-1,4-benzoquinol methylase